MVHDRTSAEVLVRVFQGKLRGTWTISEEPATRATATGASGVSLQIETQPAAEAPNPAQPTTVTVLEKSSSPTERRRAERFKIKLWVVIIHGTQRFSSGTSDISLTGLSLDNKIPSNLLGAQCRIQIHGPEDGERIDMKCRIFADPRSPRRIQFLHPEDYLIERLKKWIDALRAATESNAA